MSDNSPRKSLSKRNIIIIILLIIVGILAYFLTKSNNTSEKKLDISGNNLNSSVPKQIEKTNKNNKPWQTKNLCEKYKKDYIDTCIERYNKNLIPQTAFKGCFEFADGYYDCQNYD